MSVNCKWFDYDSCNFLQKNMYSADKGDNLSKEGTGRVSHYLKYGIVRCYTMEVNYNMANKQGYKISRPKPDYNIINGTLQNEPPSNIYDTIKKHKEETENTIHFFTQADFEEFGKGACVSL